MPRAKHGLTVRLLMIVSLSGQAFAQAPNHHSVTVGFGPGAAITEQDARDIIQGMNVLLAQQGYCECLVAEFELKSAPQAMMGTPASVDTRADFDAFRTSGVTVNLVEAIDWCGGYNPPALGCAAPGGPVVLERTSPQPALAWLHEFGHAQGLSWSSHNGQAHNPQSGTLMFSRLGGGRIDAVECSALTQPSGVAGYKTLSGAARACISSPPTPGPAALEDLLAAVWIHGVPYDEVTDLGEEGLTRVRDVLQSSVYDLWPNSVLALGVLGTGEDLKILEMILASAAQDQSAVRAKLNVPIAVGYLAARNQDGQATDFITSHFTPKAAEAYFYEQAADHDRLESLSRRFIKANLYAAALAPPTTKMLAYRFDVQQAATVGQFDLRVGVEYFEGLKETSSKVRDLGFADYMRSLGDQ